MPWYSVLHIWEYRKGQREIHRHDIDDLPTMGDAIRLELQIHGGKGYGPDTLAICPTDEADKIAEIFSRKLHLRYTVGFNIYPHEDEEKKRTTRPRKKKLTKRSGS